MYILICGACWPVVSLKNWCSVELGGFNSTFTSTSGVSSYFPVFFLWVLNLNYIQFRFKTHIFWCLSILYSDGSHPSPPDDWHNVSKSKLTWPDPWTPLNIKTILFLSKCKPFHLSNIIVPPKNFLFKSFQQVLHNLFDCFNQKDFSEDVFIGFFGLFHYCIVHSIYSDVLAYWYFLLMGSLGKFLYHKWPLYVLFMSLSWPLFSLSSDSDLFKHFLLLYLF